MYDYHPGRYESEWNGGEGSTAWGEVAHSNSTGYKVRLWPAKASEVSNRDVSRADRIDGLRIGSGPMSSRYSI